MLSDMKEDPSISALSMKQWPSLNHNSDFNFLVPFYPFFLVISFPDLFPDSSLELNQILCFSLTVLTSLFRCQKNISEICGTLFGLNSQITPLSPFYVLEVRILILYVHC